MKIIMSYFTLPLLLLFGSAAAQVAEKNSEGQSGTLEKMIVANGNVAMDLDLNRLNGPMPRPRNRNLDTLRFQVGPNSFFTILVFDNALRGPELGSIGLTPGSAASLPRSVASVLKPTRDRETPFGCSF